MSDPPQNPGPEQGGQQPPSGSQQPGPPPQGSYGTAPPPPPPPGGPQQPGGWQRPGPYPPPPPPQAGPGGPGQPAELAPRFVARLIDFILLGFVEGVLVAFIVVGVLMGQNSGPLTASWGLGNGVTWAANAVSAVISAAISLAYFTLMEAKVGQTVGKMVMKLQTRGPDGGRPTVEQALKRNAWVAIGVLGAIPVVGGLSGLLSLAAVITIAVTISQDRARRHGWHDNFAGGTSVYRVG
jgi:uncharacterized RDD family membrane protein YckC